MQRDNYKGKKIYRCGACDKRCGSAQELAEHLKQCGTVQVYTEALDLVIGKTLDNIIDKPVPKRRKRRTR